MSAETYHFSFTYSTQDFTEGVAGALPGDFGLPQQYAGELKVAITDKVVFSEWWINGKLRRLQWDMEDATATYTLHGVLTYKKLTNNFEEFIPLWIPTKSGPRKFIRESKECRPQGDVCIESPHYRAEAVGMTKKVTGNKIELSSTRSQDGLFLSYTMSGDRLDSLEYKRIGRSNPHPEIASRMTVESFKAKVLPPLKELNFPDWRAYAPIAARVNYLGVDIPYDESRGTIEEQFEFQKSKRASDIRQQTDDYKVRMAEATKLAIEKRLKDDQAIADQALRQTLETCLYGLAFLGILAVMGFVLHRAKSKRA